MKKLFMQGAGYGALLILSWLIWVVFVSSVTVNSTLERGNVDMHAEYSESELLKNDQEMRLKLQEARNRNMTKTFSDVFSDARRSVLIFSWIPWFVFPFLLGRQRGNSHFFWAGFALVQIVLGGILVFQFMELLAFLVALTIGWLVARFTAYT